MRSRPPSKREAVLLLKYLVEEKGADMEMRNAAGHSALDLASRHANITYFHYLKGGSS